VLVFVSVIKKLKAFHRRDAKAQRKPYRL